MRFGDLSIGDWFHDGGETEFVADCLFIKTGEEKAYCINWHTVEPKSFNSDFEVNFVTKFIVTCEEATKPMSTDRHNPFGFEGFDKPDFTFEAKFANLPKGCIYKGLGQTYYRKITDSKSVVIWSPKQETLGKIFEKTDWKTHIGHYYPCQFGCFEFPEEGNIKRPYIEPKKKSKISSTALDFSF